MSKTALAVALAGTVLLVFALPYILAAFDSAPNGTETLTLVVLLWIVISTVSRIRSRRRPLDG